MEKQKSLFKNAIYALIKAFLSLIFPIITFPYASRILGPEGLGKANFSNSVVQYFLLIASLGISGYATREAAKIREDKAALTKFTQEMIIINVVSSLIAYTLFFISLFAIPKFEAYRPLLIVYSSLILLSMIGIEWFYKAIEEFKYITIRTFLFQIIAITYLFIFVKDESDVIHYAVFSVVSYLGSNICNFIHVRKYIKLTNKFKLEFKKHISSIFTFFGMLLITSLYTILDSTMLGFLSSDVEVGYYTAAIKFNKLSVGVLTSVFGIILPRLSYFKTNNNEEEFNQIVHKAINIDLLLCIPMVFGLFALSKPLILFFSGENYLPSVIPMKIMTPIIFSMGLATLIGGQILPSIGKEKICLYSYIVGAVFNIISNSILIPKYGAIGAAIGTLITETLVTLFQFIYLRNYLINKELLITFLQSLLSSIIMYIVLYFISKIDNIILCIFISLISGILIYSLLLLLFRNKYIIYYLRRFKSKIFKQKITEQNKD